MSVLTIGHIKKSFDGKEVLKDISLQVEEGEVVSILGPSGSGKSTLLRCATFLERAEGGEISYGDEKIVANDASGKAVYPAAKELQRAQSNFGLVFQDFNLFPHFSVMKNISDAPITIQKRDKEEVYREVRELLAKVGLEEKESAYPCELSGGQQQRVAIARALALKPKMLYFDEPTSALDPEITAEILRVLKRLAAEKMTMVIVTHEIEFAKAVSDRILFMDEGMVVEEGTPEEVIDHPKNERTRLFLKKFQV
ncbi:MAG: amino acid ABC transporter ATP-binding protein [Eubacterium sp.]|nr:amino acid ABC transporter ATP-binding protein [Eubacterium sp.]